MIRNGRIMDVKAYTEFVLAHPERPARYATYFDYYIAEVLDKEDGVQLTLEGGTIGEK